MSEKGQLVMDPSLEGARVAFVHDWLIDRGGSERLLGAMQELFPQAAVYTLVHDPAGPCSSLAEGRCVETSFLQRFPKAIRHYRSWLPFFPLAVEQFDLSGYDIIISNSHAAAKGVLTGPDQLHISNVCSPIRYAWDRQPQYLREAGLERGPRSWIVRWMLHRMQCAGLKPWGIAGITEESGAARSVSAGGGFRGRFRVL